MKTDKEIVQEAAHKLATAGKGEEYDQACLDMVEALRYGRSIAWWEQIGDDPVPGVV